MAVLKSSNVTMTLACVKFSASSKKFFILSCSVRQKSREGPITFFRTQKKNLEHYHTVRNVHFEVVLDLPPFSRPSELFSVLLFSRFHLFFFNCINCFLFLIIIVFRYSILKWIDRRDESKRPSRSPDLTPLVSILLNLKHLKN